MQATIYIEPHERNEAVEAYAQWLSLEQREQISDAPEGALIRIDRSDGKTVAVVVIEEG